MGFVHDNSPTLVCRVAQFRTWHGLVMSSPSALASNECHGCVTVTSRFINPHSFCIGPSKPNCIVFVYLLD